MVVKNKSEKLRFGLVGATSTTIDFGILFLLHSLGIPTIGANFISTSTAFCFSFAANRRYTFKSTDANVKRQILLFVIITLFGIWVIQPVIIMTIDQMIRDYAIADWQKLAIGKVLATGVTLFWNYVLYSRVVFKEKAA